MFTGKVFKFADDDKIFRQVSDRQESVSMQKYLDKTVDWADKWQMEFDIMSKCKVIHAWKC